MKRPIENLSGIGSCFLLAVLAGAPAFGQETPIPTSSVTGDTAVTERQVVQAVSPEADPKSDRLTQHKKTDSISLGTRICREGEVTYTIDILGLPDTRRSPGILIAQLDGYSEDRTRIRFRILGFDIPERRDRSTIYLGVAKMGEFAIQPGAEYWDRASHWVVCEKGQ